MNMKIHFTDSKTADAMFDGDYLPLNRLDTLTLFFRGEHQQSYLSVLNMFVNEYALTFHLCPSDGDFHVFIM